MEKEQKKNNWLIRNLLGAVILVLAIVLITQIALGIGTQHNREIAVPDFSNLTLTDAQALAQGSNVRIEVTDSIFNRRMERGAVFSQNPAPGSLVKKGRRIMLTINALQPKTVEMPDLVGYSLRQAITELQSKGLKVGKLSYVADMATNNVLKQSVSAGETVETETSVNLTLGRDPENGNTFIPLLIGYNCSTAIDNILDNSLNVGRIRYDETVMTYQDSLQAIVYAQSPSYGSENSYPMGTAVNITLTLSQAKISSAR